VVDAPEGFEVPVYRGPLKPQLLWGAHRDFTLLMAGLGALGFLWKVWLLLPLVAVLQLVAAWGTRQDEKWFQKIPRVVRYKRYYKA
jgi:type IV secretory pathway TrbD component